MAENNSLPSLSHTNKRLGLARQFTSPSDQISDQLTGDSNPAPSSNPAMKFRPHTDVLNRIVHDSSYDTLEYVIGYLDRFDGIIEVGVEEWMERREVAHEEFIPGHRIMFFKRISCGRSNENGSNHENGDEDGNLEEGKAVKDKTNREKKGDNLLAPRRKDDEEEWDGTLTEDISWDEWARRGLNPSVKDSGNGKIPGEIVWDRRSRIDLIFF